MVSCSSIIHTGLQPRLLLLPTFNGYCHTFRVAHCLCSVFVASSLGPT